MKDYLKKFGVRDIVINPPIPSNKKTKTIAQKYSKDNTIALKFVINGLSSSVKESVGEYTSAKYLWFKLQSECQKGNQDTNKEEKLNFTEDVKQEENEEQALDINDGKDISYYSSSDCNKVENDLEDAKKYFLAQLLMDIDLKYNLRLKRKILGSLKKYHKNSTNLLKKLNHKKTHLQDELEDKVYEIERLNTKLISQQEETREYS